MNLPGNVLKYYLINMTVPFLNPAFSPVNC
jgi:hypothetical protein